MSDHNGRDGRWADSDPQRDDARRGHRRRRGKARRAAPLRPTLDALEVRTLLSTIVDFGDSYRYGDQAIPLQRSADQLVIGLEPGAGGAEVLARLTAAGGPLAGFTPEATASKTVWTVTRPDASGGTPQQRYEDLTGRIAAVVTDTAVAYATPSFVLEESGESVLVTDEVHVALNPGADPAAVLGGPQFTSYRPVRGTADQFIATVTADAGAATLALANSLATTDPRIAWATPDFYVTMQPTNLNDPLLSQQWHLNNTGQAGGSVGADAKIFGAWTAGATGSGVLIAILDDSVEITHPDLAPNLWVNPGEIPGDGIDNDGNGWIDDVNGWDFADDDNNPNPVLVDDDHGTSVAGVAAARGDNDLGVSGVAYQAQIMAVRLPLGRPAPASAFSESVYYASGRTADGLSTWKAADVLNHSYGGALPIPGVQAAFDWSATAGRGGLGAVNFAATGNSGIASISYPAAYPSTIAVGASTDSDQRSGYSQYGPQIDFVAPSNGGQSGILTTDRVGANGYDSGDYTIGLTPGRPGTFGGTSSATPLASGIGAMVLQANPVLTFNEVRQLLRSTADKIGGVTYDSAGFHIEYGYGRLNATEALARVLSTVTVVAPPGLAENQAYSNLAVGTIRFANASEPPANYTITVDFGDGSGPVPGAFGQQIAPGTYRVVAPGTRTFIEGGNFVMTVSLYSGTRLVNQGRAPLPVIDMPILANGTSHALPPGGALGAGVEMATFQDTDIDVIPPGRYAVEISWLRDEAGNDLLVSAGSVTVQPGHNRFSVRAVQPLGAGSYTALVRITGPGGSKVVATTLVNVEDANLIAQGVDPSILVPEGGIFSGLVATFTDDDPRDLDFNYYRAEIDWKNGPYTTGPLNRVIRDRSTQQAQSTPLITTLTIDKGPFTIADLDLNLDLVHPRFRDLRATLTGPDGTTVTLFDRPPAFGGISEPITLDDEATRRLVDNQTPYSGQIRPASLLSAFDGKELSGTWTLMISDEEAGLVGHLNSWSISARSLGQVIRDPFHGGNSFQVFGEHVFAAGNPDIEVIITDSDPAASQGRARSGIVVRNQHISTHPLTFNATEGQPYSGVVGSFVDQNRRAVASDFTAMVVLEDQTTVPAIVVDQGLGRFFVAVDQFLLNRPSRILEFGHLEPVPVTIRLHERGYDEVLEVNSSAVITNPPLVVQSLPLTITEGQPAVGIIAHIRDANLAASPTDYTVQVDLGGGIGRLSATVHPDGSGVPGHFVVVVHGPPLEQPGIFQGTVQVLDPGGVPDARNTQLVLFQVQDSPVVVERVDAIDLIEQTPSAIAPVLARFTDPVPNPGSVFSAVVAWGDGQQSPAAVVDLGGGRFEVRGDHLYSDPGLYTAVVTIQGAGGSTATAVTTARVSNRILPLTGTLDPASDRGTSANDWVTSVPNPTFRGTFGEPGSMVKLYAVSPLSGATLVGFGIVDALGTWQAPIIPLADGVYQIFAYATDAQNRPGSNLTPLNGANGAPLVIDTTGPRLASAVYDTRIGAFRITYSEALGGSGALNPAIYRLTLQGRAVPLTSLSLDPADPRTVLARFNTGRRLNGQATLTIQTAGLTDTAGNAWQSGASYSANYNLAARGPLVGPQEPAPTFSRLGVDRFLQFLRDRLIQPRRF